MFGLFLFIQFFVLVKTSCTYYYSYFYDNTDSYCYYYYSPVIYTYTLSIWGIIGIVIGCLVAVGIFVAVVLVICCRRKRGSSGAIVSTGQPMPPYATTTNQPYATPSAGYPQQYYGGQPYPAGATAPPPYSNK